MATYALTNLKWTDNDGKHWVDEGDEVPSMPKEIKESFEEAGAISDTPPLKGANVEDVLQAKEEEIANLRAELAQLRDGRKTEDELSDEAKAVAKEAAEEEKDDKAPPPPPKQPAK
jgi:hypothetical protein